MNIMISGLTAAGKTTHSEILSEMYGFQVIAVREILANVVGIKFEPSLLDSSFWISEQAKLLNKQREENYNIDRQVDNKMIDLSQKLDNIIFDAWGLPWLSKSLGLRIWLESSLESRLLKGLISHRQDKEIVHETILQTIQTKDDKARSYFLQNYKFDIYKERQVFDLVIDISSFIKKAHPLSSRTSIKKVDEIISSIVGWYVKKEDIYKERFKKCLSLYGSAVFIKYPEEIIQ